MKIIDLLKEKQELVNLIEKRCVYDTMQVKDSESERLHKKYEAFVKSNNRFSEICDKLHTVYAKTKINVPFYGEISIATAMEYLRASEERDMGLCCVPFKEFELSIIKDYDFKSGAMQRANAFRCDYDSFDEDDDSFDTDCVNCREDKEILDFRANSRDALKIAILRALVETNV